MQQKCILQIVSSNLHWLLQGVVPSDDCKGPFLYLITHEVMRAPKYSRSILHLLDSLIVTVHIPLKQSVSLQQVGYTCQILPMVLRLQLQLHLIHPHFKFLQSAAEQLSLVCIIEAITLQVTGFL